MFLRISVLMIQYTVKAQVKTDVDVYEADGKTEIL